MNKEEQKQYNVALTYHYLKEQDPADEVAMEMDKRLENVVDKDDVAQDSVVSDDDSCSATSEKMSSTRTLSRKYVGCTWKQRAVIIFIFLHPEIGRRSHEVTCFLTGVKERTLSGWLTQKRMIQMWVDVVEDMKAEIAIRSLPAETQDLFMNIDPESTVSACKYRSQLNAANTVRVYYKGGKVSDPFYFSICCSY
jgi:hypothetical protein